MDKRPKTPKKYFEKRPRNFEDFLNQLANTVSDMHEYIVKLDKYIAEQFDDMKKSDMNISQRMKNINNNDDVENLEKEINSLREKLNKTIINIEENKK